MLEIPGFRLLLDCGLFQGRRDEAHRQNRDVGFDPKAGPPSALFGKPSNTVPLEIVPAGKGPAAFSFLPPGRG